jgi:hypothetical protein
MPYPPAADERSQQINVQTMSFLKQATDVAGSVLRRLKRGQVALARVADTMAVWNARFSLLQTVGEQQHQQQHQQQHEVEEHEMNQDNQVVADLADDDNNGAASKRRRYTSTDHPSDMHAAAAQRQSTAATPAQRLIQGHRQTCEGSSTASSSSVPRTPSMPNFRSTFARTPALLLAQRQLLLDTPDGAAPTGAGRKWSPPKSTRLFMPSKTPGPSRRQLHARGAGQDDASDILAEHCDELEDLDSTAEGSSIGDSPSVNSTTVHEELAMQYSASWARSSRKKSQEERAAPSVEAAAHEAHAGKGSSSSDRGGRFEEEHENTEWNDENERLRDNDATTPTKPTKENELRTPSLQSPLAVSR